MKRLKQSEQVLMPAIQPPPQPMIIIIADPTAQSLPFPLNDLPHYRQVSAPYKSTPRQSRLRRLMRHEHDLLQDAFDEFGAATQHLIGTLVSWVVWRILLPLSVLSVLWIALASPAELPI